MFIRRRSSENCSTQSVRKYSNAVCHITALLTLRNKVLQPLLAAAQQLNPAAEPRTQPPLTVIIRPSGWACKESVPNSTTHSSRVFFPTVTPDLENCFVSSGLQPDHRQSFVDV